MSSVKVNPWQLEVGDRILGTSLVIQGGPTYSCGEIGSDKQRQRYTYALECGKSITYTADSPGVTVIRKESHE